MTLLIFTWYLLTFPTDKLICQLWINQPPTQSALIAACGTTELYPYRLDVLQQGKTVCSVSAAALQSVAQECKLTGRLDEYTLNIIKPQQSELVCSLTLEHEGQPTDDDITAQCPGGVSAWLSGKLKAQLIKSQPKPPSEAPAMCAAPVVSVGAGIYQQAASVDAIRTDQALTWLAGRLIWFGIIRPDCGGSGLDPETLAANSCGMIAARARVTQWQNQFDSDIYTASVSANVPARLLKRMMLVESQMWPLFGSSEETGMMQVTSNGADVLLRYSTLDPKYISMTTEAQYWKRHETLNTMNCDLCSLDQALQRTRELIPTYARMLAAYRCRAVELNPSLSGDAAWQQAAADYNGSIEYLKRIEQ